MPNIKITFPDGAKKEFESGITPKQIAESIGPRLAKEAVAAFVNEELVDLDRKIEKSSSLRLITLKDGESVDVLRHSTAHLLAQAVLRLFPEAKPTIGPVVEEGFYYDFDLEHHFTPEDLARIEQEMMKIAKEDRTVERMELDEKEAKKLFKDNPYKLEIIDEQEKEGLSAYKQGEFTDLCRGPHVPRTGMLRAVKLTKLAGAYWRGDAKNRQLQRIYGISFPDKKLLKEHLEMMAQAEKRNHVVLGERLGLFSTFEEIGKGLPVWLPKGEIIRQEIERFAIETEEKAGYVRVATPHLAKKELFLRSGHLPYYEDSMYPAMKMDDGTYYLKAMNCPMHHLIYSKFHRSYRDLPVRIAEYGTCYRNELSGTLTGLLRVRILRMNDAHIYCRKDQIEEEIENVITLITYYLEVFGLHDYWFRLSLGDISNKEKYIDEPENWAFTENILRRVLQRLKVKFVEAKNEAAFYGPKIDIQFKNVHGREETMSTVQLDFAAKKRFTLSYADKDGNKNNEVFVIHRAPLSVHERFVAFLIEQYAGKFPLWLSPEQVRIVTVADAFNAYAETIEQELRKNHVRVHVDKRAESIPKEVREAQLEYVPLIVTVGEKEQSSKTVAVRTLDGKVNFGIGVDDFVKKV